MDIHISETRAISIDQILALYKANKWSAAEKPETLHRALLASHTLVTAWDGSTLAGLGNAISDGHLVVYYPHLLVLPRYQGKGIGRMIMDRLREKYRHFHMQMLTADAGAVEFYKKAGFSKAGKTEAMWIYQGNEH